MPEDNEQKTPVYPKCPSCGDTPLKISQTNIAFPQGQIGSLTFCAACGELVPIQIIGQRPSIKLPRLIS